MRSTRREFVGGAAAVALAHGAANCASVISAVWQPARAQPSAIKPRRSIATMSETDPDIVAYRAAVSAMRALPADDSRNWTNQASIHADFCPHRNWYFLPWHRAYLAAFERICRDLSGKADFALPYWDWSVLPTIPPAFASGTPATNPLNHPRPGLAANQAIRPEFVGPDVIAVILESPDFESLGSTRPEGQDSPAVEWLRQPGSMDMLESRPHNTVHSALGGDMRTMMSPLDPIFWLHHCNVDRIWAMWNARGGLNSTEPNWLELPLHGQFVNADGSAWDVRIADVTSLEALAIAFDDVAAPAIVVAEARTPSSAESSGRRLARFRNLPMLASARSPGRSGRAALADAGIFVASVAAPGVSDRQKPLTVNLKVDRILSSIAAEIAAPGAASPRALGRSARAIKAPRVLAIVEGIPAPAESQTSVRVFLNKRDIQLDTPVSDPHYVTSFSFFDHPSEHGGHAHGRHGGSAAPRGSSIEIDLSTALARLQRLERLNSDEIVLQLVTVAPDGAATAATAVKPARVDVVVL